MTINLFLSKYREFVLRFNRKPRRFKGRKNSIADICCLKWSTLIELVDFYFVVKTSHAFGYLQTLYLVKFIFSSSNKKNQKQTCQQHSVTGRNFFLLKVANQVRKS